MASTNISLTIDYVKFVKFTLEGVAYTPVAILGFFGIFSGLIKYHFTLRDIRSGGRCHNTRLCLLGHFSKYIIPTGKRLWRCPRFLAKNHPH